MGEVLRAVRVAPVFDAGDVAIIGRAQVEPEPEVEPVTVKSSQFAGETPALRTLPAGLEPRIVEDVE